MSCKHIDAEGDRMENEHSEEAVCEWCQQRGGNSFCYECFESERVRCVALGKTLAKSAVADQLRPYLDQLLEEARYQKEQGRRPAGQLLISIVADLRQMFLEDTGQRQETSKPGDTP